ncbi:MAG: DUF3800 domain-containing protein [Thermodesulfovibrionales bacterium]
MSDIFNIYCDESCYLENDGQKVMVLGAIWCLKDKAQEISRRIREKKKEHGLTQEFEIKWTKVSPSKRDFYLDVVDYFFDDDDLHFRALIVPDKSKLKHSEFSQTHDDWYYKMYFDMLKVIISPDYRYRVYLDIKDTRGNRKVQKLHEVLSNEKYDFKRSIIEFMQLVHSHDIQILQLADLLIGAISYLNRGLSGNEAKEALIARMKERSGYSLTQTTLYRENKMNLFRWQASENNNE